MNEQNPYAAPKAELRHIEAIPKLVEISTLAVSDSWKIKFQLLEKAGGVKMPKLRELSTSERMKITFNILAFLFGPLYYAGKGMWKKGFAMFAIGVVAILLLSFVLEIAGLSRFNKALGYGMAAVFAVRANIDYYKKMVLKQNDWL